MMKSAFSAETQVLYLFSGRRGTCKAQVCGGAMVSEGPETCCWEVGCSCVCCYTAVVTVLKTASWHGLGMHRLDLGGLLTYRVCEFVYPMNQSFARKIYRNYICIIVAYSRFRFTLPIV